MQRTERRARAFAVSRFPPQTPLRKNQHDRSAADSSSDEGNDDFSAPRKRTASKKKNSRRASSSEEDGSSDDSDAPRRNRTKKTKNPARTKAKENDTPGFGMQRRKRQNSIASVKVQPTWCSDEEQEDESEQEELNESQSPGVTTRIIQQPKGASSEEEEEEEEEEEGNGEENEEEGDDGEENEGGDVDAVVEEQEGDEGETDEQQLHHDPEPEQVVVAPRMVGTQVILAGRLFLRLRCLVESKQGKTVLVTWAAPKSVIPGDVVNASADLEIVLPRMYASGRELHDATWPHIDEVAASAAIAAAVARIDGPMPMEVDGQDQNAEELVSARAMAIAAAADAAQAGAVPDSGEPDLAAAWKIWSTHLDAVHAESAESLVWMRHVFCEVLQRLLSAATYEWDMESFRPLLAYHIDPSGVSGPHHQLHVASSAVPSASEALLQLHQSYQRQLTSRQVALNLRYKLTARGRDLPLVERYLAESASSNQRGQLARAQRKRQLEYDYDDDDE